MTEARTQHEMDNLIAGLRSAVDAGPVSRRQSSQYLGPGGEERIKADPSGAYLL
jgi:hypothetical protein